VPERTPFLRTFHLRSKDVEDFVHRNISAEPQ
jgi:hypothetical protein